MFQALVERLSTAAGQIGRRLKFRSDLSRYQISVEKLENFVTVVEGGITRSPGTRMVMELKNQAQRGKLVPFRISTTEYFMLVINDMTARFVQMGGVVQNPDTTPHELAVLWSESDLDKLRWASTGNLLYVVDGTRFEKITYTSALSWARAAVQVKGGPVDTQNLDTAVTIQAGAVTGNVTLTGVGNPLKSAWIGQVIRIDDRDLSLTKQWVASETGLSVGDRRRWNGRVYSVVSGANAGPNPPTHEEGDISAGNTFITWRFLDAGYGFLRVNTVTNGNAGTGTVLVDLPATAVSAGSFRWSPPAWNTTDGYPTAIAFASPRMFLGRDDLCWLSATDDPEDHAVLIKDGTIADDSAIAFRLRAPDGSLVDIQWAMAAGALMVGTSDIEWALRAATLYEPLTGKNIKPVPEDNRGSIAQIACFVDGGVMFAGKNGKRLYYATIDPEGTGSQRVTIDEVSVQARELFKAGIKAMAWQRDPERVLWIIFDDGTLKGFTFMPAQKIASLNVQPRTNAFFEDVAVIPSTSAGVDEVYFIVRRTILGQTKRYVEQLADFFEPADDSAPTALGAWFLDCAISYEGVAKQTFTNFAHLAGQEVGVFANGAMQPRQTVSEAGALTLARAATTALIGLPVRAYVKDLPRMLQVPTGPVKGKKQTIHDAVFDLEFTGGGKARVVNESGEEMQSETLVETGGKKSGSPVRLISGTRRLPIEAETGDTVQLELICDDAMPCTVLGMSPRAQLDEDE